MYSRTYIVELCCNNERLYIKCIYSKISLDCYWQIHNEDIFKRKVSESIFDLVNCHGIVNIRFLCNHFYTS